MSHNFYTPTFNTRLNYIAAWAMRFIFIVYNTTYKNNKRLIYRTGLKWWGFLSPLTGAQSSIGCQIYSFIDLCVWKAGGGVTGFNCSKWSRLMSFSLFLFYSHISFPSYFIAARWSLCWLPYANCRPSITELSCRLTTQHRRLMEGTH